MTVGYSDNKFTGYPVLPGPLIGLSKNDDGGQILLQWPLEANKGSVGNSDNCNH